jgi:hypothetical protein
MAHETSEPKNLLILGIGVGSIVTLVAVLYGLQSYYYGMRDFEQHEKVLGRPNPDLVALRTNEERRLTTYAKLDPDGKRVRIPVDKAIGLLAQRGRDGFPAIRPDASAQAGGAAPSGSAPATAGSATPATSGSARAPVPSGAPAPSGASAPSAPRPGGAPPAPGTPRPPAPGGGR